MAVSTTKMSSKMVVELGMISLILISLSQSALCQETTTHSGKGASQNPQSGTRKTDSTQTSDDWCFGHLNEDEKKQLQNEAAKIFSNYLSNHHKEKLQSSLSKVIENHTGFGNYKKGAAVGAQIFSLMQQLQSVQRFSEALSNLSNKERTDDTKLNNQMKEIQGDFEKLSDFGLKYDSKQNKWDMSGVADRSIQMESLNPELKQAFENLVSPEIAKKLFDPERKEAFNAGGMVFRPPQNDILRAVTEAAQNEGVKRSIDIITREKQAFLEASKESNTLGNSMTGQIPSLFGAERGHNGETSPEIARRKALENMENQLRYMQNSLGLKAADVQPVYGAIQGAIREDSRGLAALDQELTDKIDTLKKTEIALGAIVVSVATAGILAPGALAIVLGASTTTSTVATAMAVPLILQVTVGAVNTAIESSRNGTSLSCAAMNEVYKRGAGAVASAVISGVFPVAGAGAAGAAGILKTAGTLLPQAVTGSQTLARLGTTTGALGNLGLGGYFSYQGVNGLLQGQSQVRDLLRGATEAEARGDKAIAAQLRTEAMKQGVELFANGAMEAIGLRNLNRGYRELHQPQANRAQSEIKRKLTAKQRTAVEEAHLSGAGELGADGTPAGLGNYTKDQLQTKYNILGKAKFTKEEIQILMDRGIVGNLVNYVDEKSEAAGKALVRQAHKAGIGESEAIAVVRGDGAPPYQVNPKHVKGTVAYQNATNSSLIPENHVELYRNANRAKNGDYWALDSNGNYHRFEQANDRVHWSGSTNLKKPGKPGSKEGTLENPDPIDFKHVPKEIRQKY